MSVFIELIGLYIPEDEPDYQELGIKPVEDKCEAHPTLVNITEIKLLNRYIDGRGEEFTVIEFKNGDRLRFQATFEETKRLISEATVVLKTEHLGRYEQEI